MKVSLDGRFGRGMVRWAVCGLLLLTLAGCRGSEPAAAPTPSESEDVGGELDRSRIFKAKVHAEGTGAAAFTWDGEQDVVVTRVGRHGLDVNLLSAGFAVPQKVTNDPAHRFRWAFDLLQDYADEPSTFTLDGVPEGAQGLRSQAFLIWLKAKDPSQEVIEKEAELEYYKEFNRVDEPCTLEVGELERAGTLRCPKLSTVDGAESTSLLVSWEQIGPDREIG